MRQMHNKTRMYAKHTILVSVMGLTGSFTTMENNFQDYTSPEYFKIYQTSQENFNLDAFRNADDDTILFLSKEFQAKKFEEFKLHVYDDRKSSLSPWSQDFVAREMHDQDGKNCFYYFLQEADKYIAEAKLKNEKSPVDRYAQPISIEFLESLKYVLPKDSTLLKFDSKNRAICLKNTHIRALPTEIGFYYAPFMSVMGTLCDELQNDTLFIGEPVYIVYELPDKSWVLMISATYCGWVKGDTIARVDEKIVKRLTKTNSTLACITKATHAYLKNGINCNELFAGSILDYIKEDQNFIFTLIPKTNSTGTVYLEEVGVKKDSIVKIPLKPTNKNFVDLLQNYIRKPYNWGGELYFGQDCSSLTKSVYAAFGIFLRRNSGQQAATNFKSLDIGYLDTEARVKTILEQAQKFSTLIWFPGHIMIYMGKKLITDEKGNKISVPIIFNALSTLSFKKYEEKNIINRCLVGQIMLLRLVGESEDFVSLVDSNYRKKYKLIYLNQENTSNN